MPSARFGNMRVPLPANRIIRVTLGILLVVLGLLGGFLPILGYWMVPAGLVVLSIDFAIVRRWRRRSEVWLTRHWRLYRRRPAIRALRRRWRAFRELAFVKAWWPLRAKAPRKRKSSAAPLRSTAKTS